MINKNFQETYTKINQKDITHVFFVVNPMTVIISRLIIDNLKLSSKNILIVSFRNTDITMLNYKYLKIRIKKVDRYLERLFFQSPSGNEILNQINNKKFLVYASWANRELNWLMREKNCIGHSYIEEGQGSYMKHVPYSRKNIPILQKIKNNLKNRVNDNEKSGFFFRDDAIAYFGISKDTFPMIQKEKIIIFNDLKPVLDYYSPKLIGVKNIGLTCAERRLKDNDWKKMITKLVSKLPKNAVIKPHPSFTLSDKRYKKLKSITDDVSAKKIDLCSNDVIIELEMLYEKKYLIGPITSLSIYSRMFGSKFKKIQLY